MTIYCKVQPTLTICKGTNVAIAIRRPIRLSDRNDPLMIVCIGTGVKRGWTTVRSYALEGFGPMEGNLDAFAPLVYRFTSFDAIIVRYICMDQNLF